MLFLSVVRVHHYFILDLPILIIDRINQTTRNVVLCIGSSFLKKNVTMHLFIFDSIIILQLLVQSENCIYPQAFRFTKKMNIFFYCVKQKKKKMEKK